MTIEEKRRELFEAHWSNAYGYSRTEAIESGMFSVNDRGIYRSVKLNESWHTWNAALDAVVIELPPRRGFTEPKEAGQYWEDAGFNNARAVIRASIESTGLGLKVLP